MICSSDVKTAVIARTIIFVKKKKEKSASDYEKTRIWISLCLSSEVTTEVVI